MSRIIDQTVTADGNTDVTWHADRREPPLRGTITVFGSFGGGTVTMQYAVDGGTTFVPLLDVNGTAITFTADGGNTFELYTSRNTIPLQQVVIRFALAGATTPSIRYVIDNGS